MGNLGNRGRYLVFLEELEAEAQWWHFSWGGKNPDAYCLTNANWTKKREDSLEWKPADIFRISRGRMNCSTRRGLSVDRDKNPGFWKLELKRLNHSVRVAHLLRDRLGSAYQIKLRLPDDLRPYGAEHPQGTDSVIAIAPREDSAPRPRPKLLVEVRGPTEGYVSPRNFTQEVAGYARVGDYWLINLESQQLEVRRPAKAGESATQSVLGPPDSIAPLIAPQTAIVVADLLLQEY